MLTKNNKPSLLTLSLLTMGIVYGDIGTSPLYAFRAAFSGEHPLLINQVNVYGVLSLIFWLFVLVVSLKYLNFVTHVNNKGEGGILTLTAMAMHQQSKKIKVFILIAGLLATGFFFGEAIITPAMSVLSAIEGIKVITPKLNHFIEPITITIICFLFAIQSYGTHKIGRLFAPVMVTWFVVLMLLGGLSISHHPQVLTALNPLWALHFIVLHQWMTIFTLAVVVLAVTGVEALYADMGHFGIKPIRYAWFSLVFPSLVINYFGQGALILADPSAVTNPFFNLAPTNMIIPLVILATLATIIASQAVISSVFSITRQAVNLGYLPPVRITHTSVEEQGQIYVPLANLFLFVAVILVILGFKHSENLAAAYGIAVTMTMTITSLLSCIVAWRQWHWSGVFTTLLAVILLSIDLPLFISTTLKFVHGGWLPLTIGLSVFSVMMVWYTERRKLVQNSSNNCVEALVNSLEESDLPRVKGNAIYLTREIDHVPLSLLNNLKLNKVLHERIILLTCQYEEEPYVHPLKRVEVKPLSDTFFSVTANYGYKETPDIEQALYSCSLNGLYCQLEETIFFMSSERLKVKHSNILHDAKAGAFIFLSRNALRTSEKLKIPEDKLVELGTQLYI
ncbi:potassium transporter Kup [Shewanella sp. NFH-SH190041]|uniref:potassium transporter Kup n=1 Tax=Shewanella sp. NFH-SH190041 TaxID=2950245 RepID=UPI0021C4932F|nr:potassium transporter Kup [Shewanella sp. NFH-SH190041]